MSERDQRGTDRPAGDQEADAAWHRWESSGNGLVCDVCHSLVRSGREDVSAHLDWHARLDAALRAAAGA